MHIFFSGIGGAGIGPLALIAKQAGYEVSGSDKQHSQYIDYLKNAGITNIYVGQTAEAISEIHARTPIDWFVYSGALPRENPQHPELVFCAETGIKSSKRDELLNQIITDKNLRLIAVAGTHGKTTTTAMIVWLFHKLNIPISYSVGAKTGFSDSGHYEAEGSFFVYECDEFDRNFLAFSPELSTITSITWDHHDIYPTKASYKDAFKQFIHQSKHTLVWDEDLEYLGTPATDSMTVMDSQSPILNDIALLGLVNRQNALQAVLSVHRAIDAPLDQLITYVNSFPGLSRRFEKLSEGVYTDYAHNAEKVRGALNIALEHSAKVVVVYEGLHNRRQHFMLGQGQFTELFEGAEKVYIVPTYLGREDPDLKILTPADIAAFVGGPASVEPAQKDEALKILIDEHVQSGALVLCLSGGGGGSLDEWLRSAYKPNELSVS